MLIKIFEVEFHGLNLIWLRIESDHSGALTTKQAFNNNDHEASYAWIEPNGNIIKMFTKIGHRADINIIKELEVIYERS